LSGQLPKPEKCDYLEAPRLAQALLRLVHSVTTRGDGGIRREKEAPSVTSGGDGAPGPAPSRLEFDRLVAAVAEIDKRVTQNRKDLDVQFQRLADLQAVIDRMQMATRKVRTKDGGL
jgi:hypothetical protein